jgi:regulator of sigma E protease
MTVIIFLLVLAVLIFVHELGHFIFARLNGIRVDAFKIGFGPKLAAWKRGETEYGINWIPFGGFVKIHGENPDEESTSGPDFSRSFVHKNRWQQASVLVAGVVFNLLFGWLIFLGILTIGGTVPTSAFPSFTSYLSNHQIIVVDAASNSPALNAGIGIGDIIQTLAVDSTTYKIDSAVQMISLVNGSAGKPLTIVYEKNGYSHSVTVSAIQGIAPGRYAVGITMDEIAQIHMPFITAISSSVPYSAALIKDTVVGLVAFVAGLFSGTTGISDVSGPVGIAVIIGNAAHLALSYLLIVVAIISINLGVINLIPFPALDGGRVLFVALEGIFRRRISPRFTNVVNTVGFVLLMILMVAVTYKDVVKLLVK